MTDMTLTDLARLALALLGVVFVAAGLWLAVVLWSGWREGD